MRVRVVVTPKDGVLDPEGRAVHHALGELGYAVVRDVRTGSVILLDVDASSPDAARELVREMCEKLLANPVIEQYAIEVEG